MRLRLHIENKTRNDVHGNPVPAFEYTICDEAEVDNDAIQKYVGVETSFERAEKDGIFRLLRHSATSAQGDKAVTEYHEIENAERRIRNYGSTGLVMLHQAQAAFSRDGRLKNYHRFITNEVKVLDR
jgi:hypothetical protein